MGRPKNVAGERTAALATALLIRVVGLSRPGGLAGQLLYGVCIKLSPWPLALTLTAHLRARALRTTASLSTLPNPTKSAPPAA